LRSLALQRKKLLWKSGPSGPRKLNRISTGFSPGGPLALANEPLLSALLAQIITPH